jgi:hypothetical protein
MQNDLYFTPRAPAPEYFGRNTPKPLRAYNPPRRANNHDLAIKESGNSSWLGVIAVVMPFTLLVYWSYVALHTGVTVVA